MRHPRLLRVAAPVVALLCAGLTACGSSDSGSSSTPNPSSSTSKSTIVIGNVGQYSGTPLAAQYGQSLHSLQAWVQWTNDHGGINGHPVKLVSHDDAGNPAKSLQFVREMVEKDHIVALLDSMGSDDAWANYLKQKKVPALGGSTLSAPWTENPYMLSANVNTTGYLTSQVGAAKAVGDKVGEFVCAEVVACQAGIPIFQKITEQLGLGWAGAQKVSGSATDYVASCLAMKEAGANVVAQNVAGSVAIRVVKDCQQQGFDPAIVMPAATMSSDVVADAAFNGTLGVNASPLWFGDADFTRDWKQTYAKMFPDEVNSLNGFSTLGWQAGVVFAKALENAPDAVTPDTVLQGLYAQPAGSTYGGWTPPLTYLPGEPAQTKSCMWYAQLENGKFTAPKGYQAVCAS